MVVSYFVILTDVKIINEFERYKYPPKIKPFKLNTVIDCFRFSYLYRNTIIGLNQKNSIMQYSQYSGLILPCAKPLLHGCTSSPPTQRWG